MAQRAYLFTRHFNADKDLDGEDEKWMDFSDIKFNNPIENNSHAEVRPYLWIAQVLKTTECSSSVSMTFSGIVFFC